MSLDTTETVQSYRNRPEWMSSLDVRILEVIKIEGNMTAKALSKEDSPERLTYDEESIVDRCTVLCDNGLLECLCGELYKLTKDGHRFLKGFY